MTAQSINHKNLHDLTGQKFNRLTVISRAENGQNGATRWNCVCECGGESVTGAYHLTHGHTKSCGCLLKESQGRPSGVNFIHGIGVNDTDESTRKLVNGKMVTNPIYSAWNCMLDRCYSNRNQAYTQCTVDPDWHYFSQFKFWAESQNWQGKHLDKDIIEPGNKHYAPDLCCFVTKSVNSLLVSQAVRRGKFPQGVHPTKNGRKYTAQVSVNGKIKGIGRYTTVESASNAYRSAKALVIAIHASREKDPRIAAGLWRHAELYRVRP